MNFTCTPDDAICFHCFVVSHLIISANQIMFLTNYKNKKEVMKCASNDMCWKYKVPVYQETEALFASDVRVDADQIRSFRVTTLTIIKNTNLCSSLTTYSCVYGACNK